MTGFSPGSWSSSGWPRTRCARCPGGPAMVPAFFSGWLTSELAPHLAGLTALDTAVHVARHGVHDRRDALGVAAAGGEHRRLRRAGRRRPAGGARDRGARWSRPSARATASASPAIPCPTTSRAVALAGHAVPDAQPRRHRGPAAPVRAGRPAFRARRLPPPRQAVAARRCCSRCTAAPG